MTITTSDRLPPAAHAALDAGLATLGLAPALAAPLLHYLRLLAHWNRAYNLTAVRDPAQMVPRHLLDSLTLTPHLNGTIRLADLGSGPGLPGIPLALAQPRLQVTLVESNGKKARFLRETVRRLELDNVDVAQTRIETFARAAAFDAITARALAPLPRILALGGRLLRADGRLLAMKAALPADEIAALPAPWRVDAVHRLDVPGLDAARHLVVIGRRLGSAPPTRA